MATTKGYDPEKTSHPGSIEAQPIVHDNRSTLTKWGLSAESFKRRTAEDATNNLNKSLHPRHIHMIAIAGSIGAGLFVGSGGALARGGPAAVVIDFLIIGFMLYNVVYALGELAIMYPVSGGFYTYSARFIDPSWGFAMGWNYVFQWVIVLPLELTVAGLVLNFWQWDVHVAVWITIFWVSIMVINIFGVMGYGESEFWASVIKLITIIGFLILGVILVCGGGPSDGLYGSYSGAKLWYDPGAFANGFKGVCSVFVTAAFAFSGTEIVGLAAAEAKNPRESLPRAVKQVFWRVTLFYVLALLLIGLLVPYNEERLIGANAYIDTAASPFVIALVNAKISFLPHFVNVVILISVMSIGNSCVYAGSRTLTALAEQGYAPKIFAYVDRAGRPLPSTIFVIAFGALAYVNIAAKGPVVFDWLLALSGLAAFFTWGSICVAHIRFRHAWKAQGHSIEEIPFRATLGVTGSWIGVGMVVLCLIAQFYVALFPLGGKPNAEAFFKAYLAFPIVMVFWAAGYFWKRQGVRTLDQIDVDTGRKVWDTAEMIAEEKEKLKLRSTGRKIFDFFC